MFIQLCLLPLLYYIASLYCFAVSIRLVYLVCQFASSVLLESQSGQNKSSL